MHLAAFKKTTFDTRVDLIPILVNWLKRAYGVFAFPQTDVMWMLV